MTFPDIELFIYQHRIRPTSLQASTLRKGLNSIQTVLIFVAEISSSSLFGELWPHTETFAKISSKLISYTISSFSLLELLFEDSYMLSYFFLIKQNFINLRIYVYLIFQKHLERNWRICSLKCLFKEWFISSKVLLLG